MLQNWDGGNPVNFEYPRTGCPPVVMGLGIGIPLATTLLKVRGSLDIDLDPEDVAEFMDLPQAEMAKVNAHGLLTSMSPFGTIDDMELIKLEEDGSTPGPWTCIEG